MASLARVAGAIPRHSLRPLISNSSSVFSISTIPRSISRSHYNFRCQIHSGVEPKTTTKLNGDDHSSKSWKIKMLYDGECPLCMREVNMLEERNESYGSIKFVDISAKDYSPAENGGLDYETVMGRIHAILADGTVVTDIDAFRRLYEAVGLGWVYAITKYEPIATIANAIYGVWAKYRMQITGRAPLQVILESRRKEESCNKDTVCKM